MGDKKKQADDDDRDYRVEFLFNYLSKSWKLKTDKWNKMWGTDEYARIILNFFNKADAPRLIMMTNLGGQLVPVTDFPSNLKTKCSYFIRKKNAVITATNIREVLFMGDKSPKPIEELSALVEHGLLPFISNPDNRAQWPSEVVEDMIKHVYAFKNKLIQIKGAIRGQTVLPMPPGIDKIYDASLQFRESGGAEVDLGLKSSIEGSVLQWTSLCNDVLQQTSEEALAHGENPTPIAEFNFWNSRLKNLESIFDQFRDPRVKKMILYLELTNSSYLSCFKCIFQDVVAAILEAKDICMYLKAVRPHIEKLDESEFLETRPFIKPLVHCLGLLWGNSQYYCTSARMVTLLKEIANQIIIAASTQLDPGSIFQVEPEDMLIKVDKCINLIEFFHSCFHAVRENVASYFRKAELQPKPWTFHPRTVFQHLMDFTERLRLVRSIIATNIEFQKLEKVEIGGIKGRVLSKQCEEIFEEFTRVYVHFVQITYDFLDPANNQIVADNERFMEKCQDFDSRLACIFIQVFDECYNMESIFKFINISGTLLDRPAIRNAIIGKYAFLIQYFSEEVDMVKVLFDEGKKNGIPINLNFPPVAGILWWLYKLKQRILKPGEDFKLLENKIVESPDALYAFSKWEQMLLLIDDEFSKVLSEWMDRAPGQISTSLSKLRIVRNGELISLNLDDELVAILREVKYMKMLDITDFAPDIEELFQRNEELFQSCQQLNTIVEYYNHLKTNTLPEEYALFKDEMDQINVQLNVLIDSIDWTVNSDEFVKNLYDNIKQLYDRVLAAQKNIGSIIAEIQSWGKEPLYERKEGLCKNTLQLDDRLERLNKRYGQISATSRNAVFALQLNYKLFFNIEDEPEEIEEVQEEVLVEEPKEPPGKKGAKPEPKKDKRTSEIKPHESKEQEAKRLKEEAKEELRQSRELLWRPYEMHVDNLILNVMLNAIKTSVNYLEEESSTVKNPNLFPLFELLLEIHDDEVVYVPSIDPDDISGFLNLVRSLIEDMYCMAKCMARIDKTNEDPDYLNDALACADIKDTNLQFIARVKSGMEAAEEYLGIFDDYAYLWQDDRREYLQYFLRFSRMLSYEEIEMLKEDETAIKERPPTTVQFKEQIDVYDALYKTIHSFDSERIISGWLRIDVRPLRQAVLNIICKWGSMFKQHLFEHVISSLSELDSFVAEAIAALQVELSEDDYEGLLSVMGYLVKIRDRQTATDGMFQPIKEIMELLKEYGVEFSEEIYIQLQELPDKWNQCKKVSRIN
ncbi:dynein beta chain, ciliary-like [Photinus pyralis]|uniref:dynein beta chain, ciliary-like n=1 Tax=Photinus pyralis TaxID=7054 RepID=UPI0012676351|nr:dynein beta chain, ciliary-like [Photinus pyralis]